jgi:hypothetical protein
VQTQTCKWGSPKWNVVLEEDIIGQKWKVSIWAVTYLNWFAKWSTTAFTIITTILLVFLVHTIHSHTEWSEVKWSEVKEEWIIIHSRFHCSLQVHHCDDWFDRDHVFWLQHVCRHSCADFESYSYFINKTHEL